MSKKGFICDLDGVICRGKQMLPGGDKFVDWLKKENKKFLFLSNNSNDTPRSLQQKLSEMGLDVSQEHFYTSALATVDFLKTQLPGCSVYVVGETGLKNTLCDAGIRLNDSNPDYVVMGEGECYSQDTLTRATNFVKNGAKLIGTNYDIKRYDGKNLSLIGRTLIVPIEWATGKQAYFCGKPNPFMMRSGLNFLGCHSSEVVVVGDRMDTDIISGIECGMSTILVLSGVSSLDTVDKFSYRPSMLVKEVGNIVKIAEQQKKNIVKAGKWV